MYTVEEIILKLNEILEFKEFPETQFLELINLAKKQYCLNVKILDFEKFNEQKQEIAKNEKIHSIKAQNFEIAANWRDIEKKCIDINELKLKYNILNSMFRIEQKYLLFFFLGTFKNDKLIKDVLIKQKFVVKR